MAETRISIVGRLAGLTFAEPDAPAPAEHLPSGRELRRYAVAGTLAVLPAMALACYWWGIRPLAVFGVAFAAGRLAELAVARVRGKRSRGGALTVAVFLALVLPVDVPLWLVLATAAFGVFFGKEVFGGTGHNFLNPVLLGQAFFTVSYPTLADGPSFASMGGATMARLLELKAPAGVLAAGAILLAGIVLLLARAVDWRTVAGIAFAAMAGLMILRGLEAGALPRFDGFVLGGGSLFGTFVLAGDPATSPGTRAGRWLYGLLIGLLAVIICGFTANPEFMMYAVLLGNVVAPTLDAAVLAARRQGSTA